MKKLAEQDKKCDFELVNHGAIILLRSRTVAARLWAGKYFSVPPKDCDGVTIATREHAKTLLTEIHSAGLTVAGSLGEFPMQDREALWVPFRGREEYGEIHIAPAQPDGTILEPHRIDVLCPCHPMPEPLSKPNERVLIIHYEMGEHVAKPASPEPPTLQRFAAQEVGPMSRAEMEHRVARLKAEGRMPSLGAVIAVMGRVLGPPGRGRRKRHCRPDPRQTGFEFRSAQ